MYADMTLVTAHLRTPTLSRSFDLTMSTSVEDFNPRSIHTNEGDGLVRVSFSAEELGDTLSELLKIADKNEETIVPTYFLEVNFLVGGRALTLYNCLMFVTVTRGVVSCIEFSSEEYAWTLTSTRLKRRKRT